MQNRHAGSKSLTKNFTPKTAHLTTQITTAQMVLTLLLATSYLTACGKNLHIAAPASQGVVTDGDGDKKDGAKVEGFAPDVVTVYSTQDMKAGPVFPFLNEAEKGSGNDVRFPGAPAFSVEASAAQTQATADGAAQAAAAGAAQAAVKYNKKSNVPFRSVIFVPKAEHVQTIEGFKLTLHGFRKYNPAGTAQANLNNLSEQVFAILSPKGPVFSSALTLASPDLSNLNEAAFFNKGLRLPVSLLSATAEVKLDKTVATFPDGSSVVATSDPNDSVVLDLAKILSLDLSKVEESLKRLEDLSSAYGDNGYRKFLFVIGNQAYFELEQSSLLLQYTLKDAKVGANPGVPNGMAAEDSAAAPVTETPAVIEQPGAQVPGANPEVKTPESKTGDTQPEVKQPELVSEIDPATQQDVSNDVKIVLSPLSDVNAPLSKMLQFKVDPASTGQPAPVAQPSAELKAYLKQAGTVLATEPNSTLFDSAVIKVATGPGVDINEAQKRAETLKAEIVSGMSGLGTAAVASAAERIVASGVDADQTKVGAGSVVLGVNLSNATQTEVSSLKNTLEAGLKDKLADDAGRAGGSPDRLPDPGAKVSLGARSSKIIQMDQQALGFKNGASTLSKTAKNKLTQMATLINSTVGLRELLTKVELRGYSDQQGFKTACGSKKPAGETKEACNLRENKRLAEKRAQAVVLHLQSNGLSLTADAVGVGVALPSRCMAKKSTNCAQDRRVELVLVPTSDQLTTQQLGQLATLRDSLITIWKAAAPKKKTTKKN